VGGHFLLASLVDPTHYQQQVVDPPPGRLGICGFSSWLANGRPLTCSCSTLLIDLANSSGHASGIRSSVSVRAAARHLACQDGLVICGTSGALASVL
jgi:hypothetical protein